MSSVETVVEINAVESPDFYWKFRLDRLVSKKGGDLAYSPKNYADVVSTKDLYDAYYLDLTLQGKLDGFDWVGEKEITDSEWLSIYGSICKWSSEVAKGDGGATTLPSNDFDLLKQFYPQLNYRDLESPFSEEEVGAGFPYRSMKAMLGAAMEGKLNVPGYSSTTTLEASDAKKALAALKEKTMKKVDQIYETTLADAKNPFPDADAKKHYQALKVKLATFPQSSSAWGDYRKKMDKDVDAMAKLASKKEDEHHHHDEDHVTPAMEFQAKYGLNLDELTERMAKFKSDPEGFLENSIIEKYGRNGLEIWKKSQEFSAKMSTMSEAEKTAVESQFTSFLNSA